MCHQQHGALDHVVQIHAPLLRRPLAREGQEVSHDAPRALRLLVDHPQVAAVLARELLLLEQELRQPRDRGERIVELVGDARHELAHGGELLALDELRLHVLLVGDVLHQDDDARLLLGARDAGRVHAQRPAQGRRAQDERLSPVAAPGRGEQFDERGGLAQQGRAEIATDHRGNRAVEHRRERTVGPADRALDVHDGDSLAQRVERRLPLLLGVMDHLEEARVCDDDRRVRGDRGQEPDVLRGEHAVPWLRDHQRADQHAVRPQRHDGGGGDVEAGHERSRLARPAVHQLDALAVERARDQPRVVGADGAAPQVAQRTLRRRDREGAVRGVVWSLALRRERHQGSLRLEEAHGIPDHLLHDAVELERAGEDVGELLEGKQLRQASIELVRGAPAVVLAALEPPFEAERPPAERGGDHQGGKREVARGGPLRPRLQARPGHHTRPLAVERG